MLSSLVTNAVRHGGSVGRAAGVRASIRTEPDGFLVVSVEDDGPGIPRREQRRVFEPFYRGRRSLAEGRPGSGLGLFIVRRTAELVGGSVALQSPYVDVSGGEHAGCRFVVRLPAGEGRSAGGPDTAG